MIKTEVNYYPNLSYQLAWGNRLFEICLLARRKRTATIWFSIQTTLAWTSWSIKFHQFWHELHTFLKHAFYFLQALIPSDRLTLALEPEVASIYIGALNVEKSRDASSSDVTLVKSAPGSRFMVVDIGGIFTLMFYL